MAEVPKAEEITHLPTGQLQGLKNCIDSNSSWVQYEVNAIAEVENILCIEMKGMILLSLEGEKRFLAKKRAIQGAQIVAYSQSAVGYMFKPIALIWAYAHLLTTSGAYKHHPVHTQMHCRTDEADLISAAPWIKIPYPLQWGAPTFEVGHAFGKFGALFASIPFLIFAAAYCVLFGFVTSAGLLVLQFTNMDLMRNLFIVVLMYEARKGNLVFFTYAIQCFNAFFNTIFFSSPMVTLMVVVFLDNTLELKDNAKDRGMPWWAKFRTFKGDSQNEEFYTLPFNLDRFFPPS
ncbi:hypothetical protein E3N88_36667 [Mikania micrantha]|uniref:Uncharacterized protein n=1 Tax=Mikania micrantha TaxID=192012 RepID=A0A5N6M4J6_9ASTR|nr:hypothetical protein E3N88_36667 [Mikania micrantha]